MDKAHTNNRVSPLLLQSSRSGKLTAPLPVDLVQSHLEKLVVSAEMRRSKKLCQFLRFTVEEVMRGNGSQLKEYAIAIGVFRRDREFDTGSDPIVRVQARRLRSKLEQYYKTEGRNEPMRIEYPVGSYSPVFVRQIPAGVKVESAPVPVDGCNPLNHIAVLPFIGVGGGDGEAFGDGLTDELIHAFSSWPGVRVIARSSCFQFKGKSEDVRRIGELLRVGAVVSGSVRIEGSHLRVLAQLIDTGTGVNLWSYAYDRELDGILVTQERISQEMASLLQPRFADIASSGVSSTTV